MRIPSAALVLMLLSVLACSDSPTAPSRVAHHGHGNLFDRPITDASGQIVGYAETVEPSWPVMPLCQETDRRSATRDKPERRCAEETPPIQP